MRSVPTRKKGATLSMTRLLVAATLACMVSAGAAHAADTPTAAGPEAELAPQADPELLLRTIRTNRKALVAANLALDPEEAAKFWPLYDRYQSEISAIGDRILAIVEEYSKSFRDLSDDRAVQLMEGYLAAEAERLQVRRSYFDQFKDVLPGRTAARFYQVENKMDAILRYDLAGTIPVVDEMPAPAAP